MDQNDRVAAPVVLLVHLDRGIVFGADGGHKALLVSFSGFAQSAGWNMRMRPEHPRRIKHSLARCPSRAARSELARWRRPTLTVGQPALTGTDPPGPVASAAAPATVGGEREIGHAGRSLPACSATT